MAVLRIHKKQKNFVILDKTCLSDTNLSWAAKGLHAYLIAMPDDWKVKVSDLQRKSRNGRDAVRALLKELEQAGYIIKSSSRDAASGRFEGIEYLVLEVPGPLGGGETPQPEKTFSETKETEKPESGIPDAGKPSPEKTKLLNINSTKYLELMNKQAAIEKRHHEDSYSPNKNLFAAASFSENQKKVETRTSNVLPMRSPEKRDACIGELLTEFQERRIRHLAENLCADKLPGCVDADVLAEEISFCMRSKKHFKGCGVDFNYKLNAIKAVIVRGEWETPAELLFEMVFDAEMKNKLKVTELHAAMAEAKHFENLMHSASEGAKKGLEEIYQIAKRKVDVLNTELKALEQG